MGEIICLIHMRAAPGRADDVVSAFAAGIDQTHAEEGCLTYALHRDAGDPDYLALLERWRSQADLDLHLSQPHVVELFAAAGEPGLFVSPPELHVLSPLGLGVPTKARLH